MAATVATMATINVKCIKSSSTPTRPTAKPFSLLCIPGLPTNSLPLSEGKKIPAALSLSATAVAGAVFSTLAASEPALAAQQIAELAEAGDNRGLALLLPIIPAIAWVLFNILQPALNQLNRMRSDKGLVVGLGLGALGASGFMFSPEAEAVTEPISMIADASSGDNRGQLLLFVVAPAILWVLYNILQPALNQLNRMRSE
ncbi:hypothetical protein SAY87_018012 [Trapa incisa]|uniref:Photosystem II core complex proteins psbY, chloroplastic n=2 Tax=Trapa TaxID=22665 RepID=A0AAN7LFU6_TRANT|nr:hypothetical protein SAY87_018012 [Trapa incisa]KAK4784515.1 hypothetical protein SAY86_018883 [Trapa natans]